MRILTLIPTRKEFEFFLRGCTELGLAPETYMLGRIPVTCLPNLELTLAEGGLGKVQFAVRAQHLIDCSRDWELVICAGAAGALDDRLAVGDVVIGTETIEYDIRNRFGEPLLPRFRTAQGVIEDLKKIRIVDNPFKMHFGAIASGDEDIVESARRERVREFTGALASAWEGAGGARASQFSGVPFVEVRGISDEANEAAGQDFEKNLQSTMKNVASVIIALARERLD